MKKPRCAAWLCSPIAIKSGTTSTSNGLAATAGHRANWPGSSASGCRLWPSPKSASRCTTLSDLLLDYGQYHRHADALVAVANWCAWPCSSPFCSATETINFLATVLAATSTACSAVRLGSLPCYGLARWPKRWQHWTF